MLCIQPEEFQSAPGREAGRYETSLTYRDRFSQFQSAPGREAGRYPACVDWLGSALRFNPRPAVRPGDTDGEAVPFIRLLVSIRARP